MWPGHHFSRRPFVMLAASPAKSGSRRSLSSDLPAGACRCVGKFFPNKRVCRCSTFRSGGWRQFGRRARRKSIEETLRKCCTTRSQLSVRERSHRHHCVESKGPFPSAQRQSTSMRVRLSGEAALHDSKLRLCKRAARMVKALGRTSPQARPGHRGCGVSSKRCRHRPKARGAADRRPHQHGGHSPRMSSNDATSIT